MKKLCVVLYVFGDNYQEYLPVFLLSLFKLYPDYGVRVYLDRNLSEKVKKQVEPFEKYDFTVIENYKAEIGLSAKATKISQIEKGQRWFFIDEAFFDYEAVYLSDIDIIFCPEKEPLFEAHMNHCGVLGKPYSNIKRTSKNKIFKPKYIARNVVKFGIKETFKYYFGDGSDMNKLSGLHFVKTKEYFEKLETVRDRFIKELNLLAEGKSKKYNLCSFRNETLLHDMVNESGMGVPEIYYKSGYTKYNISQDSNEYGYRPHHGIHLGIFRDNITPQRDTAVTLSELYKSYYRYFCELEKTEEYKTIEKLYTPYIRKIIDNMHDFYRDKV